MTWGGWSGDPREWSVAGGWAADTAAVSARLVDVHGRTLRDEIENGVFLFMWKGNFDLSGAWLDLLDADGRVTRSGSMRRARRH